MIRGDMIEMFKNINGIYKVDCSNMLPRHEIGRTYDMDLTGKNRVQKPVESKIFRIDRSESVEQSTS